MAEQDMPLSRPSVDRRTPRFGWSSAFEETFFRSLCESVQLGYKENHNFKSGAWERAATALRDRHGAYPEKSHLINKADNARKKFRMWRGLREDPAFLYNPTSRTVTASEDAWQKHFEKEPLSKSLRGRPFDHEEYMEILFPDVIGSGGAPKRIMKPRRRNPDGTMPPRQSTADTSTAESTTDSSPLRNQTPTHNALTALQPLIQPPPTPSTILSQPSFRQSTTAIPPPPIDHTQTALTPPEESTPLSLTNPRKRPAPDSATSYSQSQTQSPDKRRGRPSRFAPSFYSGSPTIPPSQFQATATLLETSLQALADALKPRQPKQYPELALEIFFREFVDEDADLQLKIAEKALCDENKALVFVKMTPLLRRHWVSRLREVYMRGLGVGRVGEEAS
ncbi:Myb/SANT-like DNA-binding domain-containing protein [Xylariaceae sp. FL1019]|nr:Myb/SANT-like DNA-binding domain-containing protein [Xylariaceae sp. FL1019]